MNIKLSVVIAYYKNKTFLKLLLRAFQQQTRKEFELVIAEDDNALDIDTLGIADYTFPIRHVSQEDSGFRKCRILNQAIKRATADRIVFIDGDCIPHPRFIESYLNLLEYPCIFGRRVMLSEGHTEKLTNGKSSLAILNLIAEGSKQIKHAIYYPTRKPNQTNSKGIWGCNWSIDKELLCQVNGFDEDYTLAGIGEDVDIEWRLRKNGVPIYYAKHRPIVYHLYHPEHYNDAIVNQNLKKLKSKRQLGAAYCINGIKKAD